MPPKNEPTATPPVEPVAPVAPVTPPKSEPVVTPPKAELPEGFELIRTEDKNKLISARDKANNSNSDNDAVLSALLQKDAVRDAMATDDFKSQFPDVSEAELLEANPLSDEQILEIAKSRQARYEKIRQDTLKKVQVATAPSISAADRDARLKELKTSKPANAFAQALRLKSMRTEE